MRIEIGGEAVDLHLPPQLLLTTPKMHTSPKCPFIRTAVTAAVKTLA